MPNALLWAAIGAVVFGLIGLISGTDETATVAPITLLVVLLGVSPTGIFTFFIAAVVAKHMTHAVPTMLLGIPGDTMAIPLMREATLLRRLGVPHIALRKAISAALISAVITVPIAVGIAGLLIPVADLVTEAAPWIFLAITVVIAYLTPSRWAGVAAMVPFVMLILGLQTFTAAHDVKLSVSYFLGIAAGPLVVSLLTVLSPEGRVAARRSEPQSYQLSEERRPRRRQTKGEKTADAAAPRPRRIPGMEHYFPNPLRVLDRQQVRWTAAAAAVSSCTFVFSPVAMTVMVGEAIRRFPRNAYHRLTSIVAVKNGTTESTYLAETLIPLVAFGLPLSPVAVGPAQPLFNAPPRFSVDEAAGSVTNLHSFLSPWEFLVFGLLGVIIAGLIVYPLTMRYAATAASFIMRKVSHEAIIAAFLALIVMISLWEGGIVGLLVVASVATVGGLLTRLLSVHAGVQFMGYYVAVLTVPAIVALV